jgi:hypothetical protein
LAEVGLFVTPCKQNRLAWATSDSVLAAGVLNEAAATRFSHCAAIRVVFALDDEVAESGENGRSGGP